MNKLKPTTKPNPNISPMSAIAHEIANESSPDTVEEVSVQPHYFFAAILSVGGKEIPKSGVYRLDADITAQTFSAVQASIAKSFGVLPESLTITNFIKVDE